MNYNQGEDAEIMTTNANKCQSMPKQSKENTKHTQTAENRIPQNALVQDKLWNLSRFQQAKLLLELGKDPEWVPGWVPGKVPTSVCFQEGAL